MAPSFDTVVSGKHPTANWKRQRISWQVSKYPKILRSRLKQHRGQLQRWGKLSFTLQRFVPLPNHLHSRRGYSPCLQAQGSLLSAVSTSQPMQAFLPLSHPFSSAPPFFSSPPSPSSFLPSPSSLCPHSPLLMLWHRVVAWESEWPENQPAADTAKGPKTTQAGFACSLLFGGGGRDECVCN